MLANNAERIASIEKFKTELTENCGGPWKEFWCEAQSQSNEIVFWILLYEDSNLKETHKVFCDILARYADTLKPLQATLSYHKFTEDGLFSVARLGGNRSGGNEAVFAALDDDDLSASSLRYLVPDGSDVYRAVDSKR